MQDVNTVCYTIKNYICLWFDDIKIQWMSNCGIGYLIQGPIQYKDTDLPV